MGRGGHPTVDPAEATPVAVSSISWGYPGQPRIIDNFTLTMQPGSRVVLVGANGAGKTTVLKLVGGKHMVAEGSVRVLGRSAFEDLNLTSTGELSYIGGTWQRDVAFAGNEVPLQADFSAEEMIWGVKGIDPARRQRLVDLLDIDLTWRMHRVSDGQRRRVQLCIGLLKPYKVLLLDEITVDLDVVARQDLLDFFVAECEERGCCILYATHIFDGLSQWATHLAYMNDGKMEKGGTLEELQIGPHRGAMLHAADAWLRQTREEKRRAEAQGTCKPKVASYTPSFPSKHMSFFR